MKQVERIACLYLSFINNLEGISFSEIKKFLPYCYTGDHESARRKFERDKIILKKLGLDIQYVGGNIGNQNAFQSGVEHKYKIVNQEGGGKLPYLQLSNEQVSHLAFIFLRFLNTQNEIILNKNEKQKLKNLILKIFYFNSPIDTENLNTDNLGKEKNKYFSNSENDNVFLINKIYNKNSSEDLLQIIYKSLRNNYKVKVTYKKETNKNDFKIVLPHGLISHHNRWCMVGLDEKAGVFKSFYIDKCESIELLEVSFTPVPKFNILDYNLHPLCLEIYNPEKIELKINKYYEELFISYISLAKKNLKNFKQIDNVYSFYTANLPALYRWMFTNPDVVERIGPKAVWNQYKSFLKK